jgi:hypothetical protein
MKKALKAVQKDLLTIIAYVRLVTLDLYFLCRNRCVSMAMAHILFFAIMAMFLFPRSEVNHFAFFRVLNDRLQTRKDTQGSVYFADLHDSVFQLLVLYSAANNPDVMMPGNTHPGSLIRRDSPSFSLFGQSIECVILRRFCCHR